MWHHRQLQEKSEDKRTKDWKELKGAVWHECFYQLLSVLKIPAEVGERITCGDGVVRWLFVVILIISADFEEQ